MFSQNEKEWILEAINHLKRRKARPDFSRISLRMKRKHQLTITQTRQLLDSLVEGGIVVKAVYKNNTSYRDVSKWKKGKLGGQIMNSSRMLQRFVKAIRSKLSSPSADGRKGTGVSATEIEEWLSHNTEDKCFLSGAALRDAIENEVSNGYLIKVENNNDTFYSVNTEKISDVNVVGGTKPTRPKHKPKQDQGTNTKGVPSDDENPRLCQVGDDIYSTEDDFNSIRMAIFETEGKKGSGSNLEDIAKWMKENLSKNHHSSSSSALSSCVRSDDSMNLLLKFLENLVKSGFVNERRLDNETQYCVNIEAMSSNNSNSGNSCGVNTSTNAIQSKSETESEREPCNNQEYMKYNLPPLLEMPPKQSNKITAVSLRPPSKRKRIQKNHGPDFEIELPTKSKARFTAAVTPKEYSFPTPLDSPVSEKSETTIEQSFKFDSKKKRGRPKKMSQGNPADDDMDAVEENKNGGLSEQSSVCQDYNDNDNEDVISEPPFQPDVSTWTPQQVADYFFDQGYEEESKQMLENDLDGVSLGLLRRSDIVGPPTGGMLKIKKLGVALKLFRDIRNFLYQGNVDNYFDPYEERAFYRS